MNENPDSIRRRNAVNIEINKHKVVIDKTLFHKTDKEKEQLKKMKAEYKSDNKTNASNTKKEEFLSCITRKEPKWGEGRVIAQ